MIPCLSTAENANLVSCTVLKVAAQGVEAALAQLLECVPDTDNEHVVWVRGDTWVTLGAGRAI